MEPRLQRSLIFGVHLSTYFVIMYLVTVSPSNVSRRRLYRRRLVCRPTADVRAVYDRISYLP